MDKKILPQKIGSEIWHKMDYGIFRAMETGKAYVSKQDGGFITVKPIKERGLPEQLQFHVRFKDQYGEVQDLDAYVDLSFVRELERVIETWRKEGVRCDIETAPYAVVKYLYRGELVRVRGLRLNRNPGL